MNMQKIIWIFAVMIMPPLANASLIDDGTWDGWIQIADDDGIVGPGGGGQMFDTEYLLYQYDANSNTLSIGLQTGFDVIDGHQVYNNESYWAGDIALSFDNDNSYYEYAIDFGLGTCGYSHRNDDSCGTNNAQGLNDAAGVYAAGSWNNDVYSGHMSSSPFAMEDGAIVTTLTDKQVGSEIVDGALSYFIQLSFDLSALGIGDDFDLDTHWTMSCGNDTINSQVSVTVPEPSSLAILGFGLIGLALLRRRIKD